MNNNMDPNLKILVFEYQLPAASIAYCMGTEEGFVTAWMLGTREPDEIEAQKLMYLVEFFREKYPDN